MMSFYKDVVLGVGMVYGRGLKNYINYLRKELLENIITYLYHASPFSPFLAFSASANALASSAAANLASSIAFPHN